MDMHEFLAHPWMANNNETKLDVTEKLGKFVQSRRRWKGAFQAVRFQNMMKGLTGGAGAGAGGD